MIYNIFFIFLIQPLFFIAKTISAIPLCLESKPKIMVEVSLYFYFHKEFLSRCDSIRFDLVRTELIRCVFNLEFDAC